MEKTNTVPFVKPQRMTPTASFGSVTAMLRSRKESRCAAVIGAARPSALLLTGWYSPWWWPPSPPSL